MAKVVFDGRRAYLSLSYNGHVMDIKVLEKYLIDFQYSDGAPGEQDSITINLDDRENKWIKGWRPSRGDKIKAEIIVINWNKPGTKTKLPCGTFEVDTVAITGPPDKVAIQAQALPLGGSGVMDETRTKTWEKVTLKTVAAEIAKRANLKLHYESSSNPSFDRLDQTDQADLAFLDEKANNEGISTKISGQTLVLFDQEMYEKSPAILTIERGKSKYMDYSFEESTSKRAYSACVVSYRAPVKKQKSKSKSNKEEKTGTKGAKKDPKTRLITATYRLPGVSGPVLKVNEQVDSVAQAQRLAKNKLREANKEAGKASLSLEGDIRLAAGRTINVKGWGQFDGKYIIESVEHSIGGTFQTKINIRKVLGWGNG